jgi:hypothetical protein
MGGVGAQLWKSLVWAFECVLSNTPKNKIVIPTNGRNLLRAKVTLCKCSFLFFVVNDIVCYWFSITILNFIWALPSSPAIALAKAGLHQVALSAHTAQALATWPVSAAIANANATQRSKQEAPTEL